MKKKVARFGGRLVQPRGSGDAQSGKNLVRHARACLDDYHLDVVSVHLDHRSEPRRLAEISGLFSAMEGLTREQQVLMGDFNALTRRDYDEQEWQEIVDVRGRNSWENPVSEVTTWLT